MSLEDLKKAVKEKELTLGSRQTLDKVKTGKVKVVYITKDCPEIVKNDLLHYTKITEVKVDTLDITASELGAIVKKQFSVSVLSY